MNERLSNGGLRRQIIRWHKYLGLILVLPLLVTLLTGALLLFPQWFEASDETITALAIDPQNPRHWIRGTDSGLQHSLDQGENWFDAPLMYFPGTIESIQFSNTAEGRVYALGQDALLVSENAGRVWDLVDIGIATGHDLSKFKDLGLGSDGSLVLLTDNGLLYQEEESSWVLMSQKSPSNHTLEWLHRLHTGAWIGMAGVPLMATLALTTVVLLGTGIWLVFLRGKRRNGHRV